MNESNFSGSSAKTNIQTTDTPFVLFPDIAAFVKTTIKTTESFLLYPSHIYIIVHLILFLNFWRRSLSDTFIYLSPFISESSFIATNH